MLKLWKNIANFGITEDLEEYDVRNVRLMNLMSMILALFMIMFMCLSIAYGNEEEAPELVIAAIAFLLNFVFIRYTTVVITKIYFCILSPALVSYFAVTAMGTIGNDKYYLFTCIILPLLIFKKKKHYLPLVLLCVFAFFFVEYLQTIIEPTLFMGEDELPVYLAINSMTTFVIIYAILHIFKREITGYQQKIELQNDLIAAKNKEVTESIEYAKNIQNAILPSDEMVQQHLPNSFILYKPKDIVAGDFYWMEVVDGKVFFACADCTGHGVPGAMVSVVCHNALDQSMKEFGLRDPGEILTKTRELVLETFEKSGRRVKDGMDIGLCVYIKDNKTIEFAGANNGMYHLRGDELIEIKPDKEPIGYFQNATPFTTNEVSLEAGDSIYLTTDGFPDQFGGEKGKKYKYKPFRNFLIKLRSEKIENQESLLDTEFENWRGEFEQVDDVCVIGVNF